MIDFELIGDSLVPLMRGTVVSLQITAVAMMLGFFLGCLLALLQQMQWAIMRFLAGLYIALFRGTPMLVQILFVYYVLPEFGLPIAPFWAASLAIGMNSGAYISQSIRAGINAVPRGQIEAAKTLGLSPLQIQRYIVLPQALVFALPALSNELVTLVKDSSLASIISVVELSKEGSLIRSRTYDAFSILLAVSAIYLTITSLLSYLLGKIIHKKVPNAKSSDF